MVLALTFTSVFVPVVINQDWQALAWTMAVVYLVALSLLYVSYKSSFGISAKHMDRWAVSAQQTFSEQFNQGHGYEAAS